jgi:hypothetical protein
LEVRAGRLFERKQEDLVTVIKFKVYEGGVKGLERLFTPHKLTIILRGTCQEGCIFGTLYLQLIENKGGDDGFLFQV